MASAPGSQTSKRVEGAYFNQNERTYEFQFGEANDNTYKVLQDKLDIANATSSVVSVTIDEFSMVIKPGDNIISLYIQLQNHYESLRAFFELHARPKVPEKYKNSEEFNYRTGLDIMRAINRAQTQAKVEQLSNISLVIHGCRLSIQGNTDLRELYQTLYHHYVSSIQQVRQKAQEAVDQLPRSVVNFQLLINREFLRLTDHWIDLSWVEEVLKSLTKLTEYRSKSGIYVNWDKIELSLAEGGYDHPTMKDTPDELKSAIFLIHDYYEQGTHIHTCSRTYIDACRWLMEQEEKRNKESKESAFQKKRGRIR